MAKEHGNYIHIATYIHIRSQFLALMYDTNLYTVEREEETGDSSDVPPHIETKLSNSREFMYLALHSTISIIDVPLSISLLLLV